MSRWEMFPYVGGGKTLGKKPLRVQILFFWALGVTWIVAGILSNQVWVFGIAAVLLITPLVNLVRQRRSSGQR
jgi:hypothetical protein